MDTIFKKLKGNITRMEAADVDLKGKIETGEAELKGKIDTKYTELEGKIDAEHAELKKNLSYAIPDYNTMVESKYCT